MEVTVGASCNQSRDQSPFPMSDVISVDFGAEDRCCYTPSISIDIPMGELFGWLIGFLLTLVIQHLG